MYIVRALDLSEMNAAASHDKRTYLAQVYKVTSALAIYPHELRLCHSLVIKGAGTVKLLSFPHSIHGTPPCILLLLPRPLARYPRRFAHPPTSNFSLHVICPKTLRYGKSPPPQRCIIIGSPKERGPVKHIRSLVHRPFLPKS